MLTVLKDHWNNFIGPPEWLMWVNITLSALSVFLFIFTTWEAIKPPRTHADPEERRWQALRVSLAFSVAVIALVFGLAGWLEGDRIGTTWRSLVKNGSLLLLILVLLLHAIMRRGDAWKRHALGRP